MEASCWVLLSLQLSLQGGNSPSAHGHAILWAVIQEPKRNWWDRNWKWVLPVGCLAGIAAFVGFLALMVMIGFGAMKSSDVYKEALARAKASPAVAEALGTPIKAGYFISGNINVSGPSGNADLSIPISGPKGKGTIYAEARKSAGEWSFSLLEVKIAGTQERIDLLQPLTAPKAAVPRS